eukprot:365694_1
MPSQGECNTKRDCNRCGGESDQNLLKCCFACHVTSLYGRLWYCSTKCQREDRKARQDTKCYILCSKVHYLPKAVEEVKDRIESFSLDQYTTENIGTFWVTEAEAGRGQIVEEREAQNVCCATMPSLGYAEGIRGEMEEDIGIYGWPHIIH